MDTLYKNITDIQLLPIRALKISYKDNNTTSNIYIDNIEGESSYSITPLIKQDDTGKVRIYGLKKEATIYVPYTNGNNALFYNLNQIANNVTSGVLALGTFEFTGIELGDVFNAQTSGYITFTGLSISVTLESTELRNRVKIYLLSYER